MRRSKKLAGRPLLLVLYLGLILGGAACRLGEQSTPTAAPTTEPLAPPTALATETSEPTATSDPTATATDAPTPTAEPTATAPPTATSEPTATIPPEAGDLALAAEQISLFPVPAIYAGDQVTIRVMPHLPTGLAPNDVDVRVLVNGQEVVNSNLNWRNFNNDAAGLYQWVWDTTGAPGEHTITATLDPDDLIQVGDENPDNNTATTTVTVQPRTALAAAQAQATWKQAQTGCCNIHVVSGTAADRDLVELQSLVQLAFDTAADKLEQPFARRYRVFFIDRVIGQGGYAGDSMVVSYLDRDYSAGGLFEVLTHEAVHLLDREFAEERMPLLSEGLAVYITGGHYQQEDIDRRAAGLIELGRDLPLAELAENFYRQQHEIGYLQGASFISYLVDAHGWEAVRQFYADFSYAQADDAADALDRNLNRKFGIGLAAAEQEWRSFLAELPRDRYAATNLEMTIRFYEVMRDYQEALDPSAYYLYAWLPSPGEALERGITADLTRHPESDANIALETMLAAAGRAMRQGDSARFRALIDGVVRVLNNDVRFVDPLTRSYLAIVQSARLQGYEVQRIELEGSRATVLAYDTDSGPDLIRLALSLDADQSWILTQ
ncbi:MAG: hypothetical protein R3300_11305 [Candidatus Promineifilaceae bacterium]|nr:hypothetical protein [Candidatus Promineifilaceae bacterium]